MTEAAVVVRWGDGKRYFWLLGLIVPILPFGAWHAAQATGWGLFWWLGPLWVYLVIPVLDFLIGDDPTNPPDTAVAALEGDRYYRAIVFAYLPVQYASTLFGAWLAVTQPLSWWEWLGLMFTVGIVNGIGINTAHELGHKRESVERWLAKIALAPVAYGHFYVEHNRGHHVRVATPEDPASARLGESFWAFLPRTMIGSLRSAWELERRRLEREGRAAVSLHSDILQAWGMSALMFAALVLWLGWSVLPFLLLQAFYGASLLEVVNYIEHYGLRRQKDASGRYERCTPAHSWNSNHIMTNLFLFHLQRHSDHHANPMRRYQALRHFGESPQLPVGYAGMVLLAYLTPLWFRVMDPKVAAHYGGELSLANTG